MTSDQREDRNELAARIAESQQALTQKINALLAEEWQLPGRREIIVTVVISLKMEEGHIERITVQ
jgi:hypothetical protein